MEKKKLVMGDAYKDALEQKKMDELRRQAEEVRKKRVVNKRRTIKARPETFEERQMKIAQTHREIVSCETKLKELKIASESNFYTFFAVLALIIFAMLFLAALVLFSAEGRQENSLSVATLAIIVLGLSLLAQLAGMKADKQEKEYAEKLKRLNNRLQSLKTNLPPPQ